MASINVTGLTSSSSFDWQTFVTTIVGDDRTARESPLTKLQTTNQTKGGALTAISTALTALQKAVATLNTPQEFNASVATTTGAGWTVNSDANTPIGTYTLDVSQLASASALTGTTGLGAPLANSSDVTGVSLATMHTAVPPTAGFFTINGTRITVNLGDSLQDLLTQIHTATGVTASYDSTTDKIQLASGSPIVLGAANDTSNFLTVAQLSNNGTGALHSAGALGVASTTATLTAANLATPITAVDGTGGGSFTVNGVAINYNINSDSIKAVINRINASTAGVTAAYNPLTGKFSLTNNQTGDMGLTISEGPGGLLAALGITGATPLTEGTNAEYTINGGAKITSASNTLDTASHGIPGLTVTVATKGSPETVTVAPNTTAMQNNIQAFIDTYNAVQTDITNQTEIISGNGKAITAPLTNDPGVDKMADQLRAAVFAAVPGISSALGRIEDLGIDFTPGSNNLSITDSTKLINAITNNPTQVAAFFQQSSTGFSANLTQVLNTYLGLNGLPGTISKEQTTLTSNNADITKQIAAIETSLKAETAQMSAQFQAMQKAESSYSQMQSVLNADFGNNNNNTSATNSTSSSAGKSG